MRSKTKIFYGLFFGCFVMAWLYAASLPLQTRWLTDYTNYTITRYQTSVLDWPHTNQIWPMSNNLNAAIGDLKLSVKAAHRKKITAWLHAVKMRPFYPYSWMHLSEAYRQNNEMNHSLQTLKFATQIGWQRVEFLKPLLGQYLLLDQIDDAKRVAKRLISINSRQTSNVYSLLSQHIDFAEFINDVIPDVSLSQRFSRGQTLDRWEYYMHGLIRDAPSNELNQIIDLVWSNATEKTKQLLFPELSSFLEKKQLYTLMNDLLADLGTVEITDNDNINLIFSKTHNAKCWNYAPLKNIQYKQVSSDKSVPPQLKVTMDFLWGANFAHLNCYIPIKISKPQTLKLSGNWSGQGFDPDTTTPLNYRINLYRKGKPIIYGKLILKNEDWLEEPLNLSINIQPDMVGMQIQFVKFKSTTFSHHPRRQNFTLHQVGVSTQDTLVN